MEYLNEAFPHIERPFAWLDLTALDENIQAVNEACGDKKVRIATKSIRSVEVLRYLQQQLTNCSGFMTFTAAETLYLLEQGLDHLLLGYPSFEHQPLYDIAHYVAQGRDVTFMVDSVDQVKLLQKVAHQTSTDFQICIDINVSTDYKLLYFGTKRSPIHSMETLTQFLQQLQQFECIRVVGCMAYDAQIAGVTDQTDAFFGLKSKLIQSLKRDAFPKITRLRQQLVAHVKYYYDLQFVNAGGTGSMALLKLARDVTEITVGSAFFAPALFSQYEALQLQPAAGFALTITRKFSEDIIVCHGGGYVASGAVGKDKQPQFLEPDVYELTSLEGAGEVQTPIIVKGRRHDIGDTVYLRHAKAGELCERFKQLQVTRNGQYIGAISTYRGDGQCFL